MHVDLQFSTKHSQCFNLSLSPPLLLPLLPFFSLMASLTSIAIAGASPKFDTDLRKLSSTTPLEKSLSLHRVPAVSPETSTEALQTFGPALYVPLLQQCGETKILSASEVVHAHIVKTGTLEDPVISTVLINAYMKCGASGHAHKVFNEIPHRNIVTWTTLISGYVRNDQAIEAIIVFIQLRKSGFYPTNFTLGAVFCACLALYSMEFGRQLHGYIIKYQLESDTCIGNSLCSLYSKCRSLKSAVKAFQRIPSKNVISWTTVISACGDNGDAELGLRMFHEMLLENATPNEFTLTSALSLCTGTQSFRLGKQVHAFCVKFGCDSSVHMKTSIMYFYLKSGETKEAMRLFDGMETVGVISWNAMIAGHARLIDLTKDDALAQNSGMTVLSMFLMMHRSGMKPDLFTFSSVLSVCTGLVALEQGEQVHAQTIKSGFLSDVVVNSALVTMYNKCGFLEQAIKAFVEMPTRTLISWTSMITAYSQHGCYMEALQLFEDMRVAGMRPNQVTFVGVLSACSHAGLIKEAEYYLNMMKEEYKIEPVMDHYACMVDLFVRLGQMEEAFMFVERTGLEPNEILWSILIAGCRTHGNMELCYYAAQRLLEQRPKANETYMLLLNMYLSAGRWQDVAKVRKIMKEENIRTIWDRSWISMQGKIYYFRADDRSYSFSSDLYGLLGNLLERAKNLGYVPYKDVNDYDGEENISSSTVHHSERLAVAFGLLNLPKEAPVRVVKNISMCMDCHSAVRYFSILTKREIIVRDSKRLHKFFDGRCSCGDFGVLL